MNSYTLTTVETCHGRIMTGTYQEISIKSSDPVGKLIDLIIDNEFTAKNPTRIIVKIVVHTDMGDMEYIGPGGSK